MTYCHTEEESQFGVLEEYMVEFPDGESASRSTTATGRR